MADPTPLLSNAATILEMPLRTAEVLVVPWGMRVRVREFTAEDSLFFAKFNGNDSRLASIVARTVIDENGNRVFTDEHIPELSKKSLDALREIQKAVMALSLVSQEARAEEKKDSAETTGDDSTTDSP